MVEELIFFEHFTNISYSVVSDKVSRQKQFSGRPIHLKKETKENELSKCHNNTLRN